MTPEGVGLTTALRVLCNVACPPPPVEGDCGYYTFKITFPEMYYKYYLLNKILKNIN